MNGGKGEAVLFNKRLESRERGDFQMVTARVKRAQREEGLHIAGRANRDSRNVHRFASHDPLLIRSRSGFALASRYARGPNSEFPDADNLNLAVLARHLPPEAGALQNPDDFLRAVKPHVAGGRKPDTDCTTPAAAADSILSSPSPA
jgi:hypothetical protein